MNLSIKGVIETVTNEVVKNQMEFNEMLERNKKSIAEIRGRMKKKREIFEMKKANK